MPAFDGITSPAVTVQFLMSGSFVTVATTDVISTKANNACGFDVTRLWCSFLASVFSSPLSDKLKRLGFIGPELGPT